MVVLWSTSPEKGNPYATLKPVPAYTSIGLAISNTFRQCRLALMGDMYVISYMSNWQWQRFSTDLCLINPKRVWSFNVYSIDDM